LLIHFPFNFVKCARVLGHRASFYHHQTAAKLFYLLNMYQITRLSIANSKPTIAI
jgi:hypothetical protein